MPDRIGNPDPGAATAISLRTMSVPLFPPALPASERGRESCSTARNTGGIGVSDRYNPI